MSEFTINEMKEMQKMLQEKYKDKWEGISAEVGQNKLLWMIGEIGEVIDIVKKNKVKCISNIFNMGYAMAVQTGIKYAAIHDYDYVIQFDADGQHIAKEANKLYEHAKKNNCDIVIGSRYLKDMGYPCPKFRRIGTKIFEKIIFERI